MGIPLVYDSKRCEEAAKEITKALRQDGIYKLIFVVMEESLCIHPEDVATINVILNTIRLENGFDVPYGIIIHKITETNLCHLEYMNEDMKLLQDCFTQKHHTNQFHFYLHDDNTLEGENDKFHSPTCELQDPMHELQDFIKNLDSKNPKPSTIQILKHICLKEKRKSVCITLQICNRLTLTLWQGITSLWGEFYATDVCVIVKQKLG